VVLHDDLLSLLRMEMGTDMRMERGVEMATEAPCEEGVLCQEASEDGECSQAAKGTSWPPGPLVRQLDPSSAGGSHADATCPLTGMSRSVSLTELAKLSRSMRRNLSVDSLTCSENDEVPPLPSLTRHDHVSAGDRDAERDGDDSCSSRSLSEHSLSEHSLSEHGSARSAARTLDGRDPYAARRSCFGDRLGDEDVDDNWSCGSQEATPTSPLLSPSAPRSLSPPRPTTTHDAAALPQLSSQPSKRPTAKRGPRAGGQLRV